MAPRPGYNESGGVAAGYEQVYDPRTGKWGVKKK